MPTQKPDPKLTDDELRSLREVLKSKDRSKWLLRATKTWALWVTAIVTGVTYGWDALGKLIRFFSNGQ